MKVIAALFGAPIFALLAGFAASVLLSSLQEAEATTGAAFFVIVGWILGVMVALMAPSAGKAWRRLMLLCCVTSFMLPIASVLGVAAHLSELKPTVSNEAEMVGAFIGGGLAVGMLGFVGFFLGVAFLVIGLLVGRDRHVVHVHHYSHPNRNADYQDGPYLGDSRE